MKIKLKVMLKTLHFSQLITRTQSITHNSWSDWIPSKDLLVMRRRWLLESTRRRRRDNCLSTPDPPTSRISLSDSSLQGPRAWVGFKYTKSGCTEHSNMVAYCIHVHVWLLKLKFRVKHNLIFFIKRRIIMEQQTAYLNNIHSSSSNTSPN